MQPDDQEQPSSSEEGRTFSLRMSRDTLLLLGALVFLILGVALTFLFPIGSDNTQTAQGTATAGTGTTVPPVAPSAGTPSPTVVAAQPAATGYPAPSTVAAQPPANGYPAPNGTPVAGGINLETTPTLTAELPPLSSTDETALALDATTTGEQPYPQPVGSPPARPTFDSAPPTFAPSRPTSVVPTMPLPLLPTPVGNPTAGGQPQQAVPVPPTLTATFPPPPSPVPTVFIPQPPPPIQPPVATATPLESPTPTTPPPPTQPPALVLKGNVRWNLADSPIRIDKNVQIAPGAILIIEPGVEIRLAPGVAIYVDGGQLLATGLPERPIRFVGDTGMRWDGIYGRPSGVVLLENVEIRGGGAGGSLLVSEQGELTVRRTRINDNGGNVLVSDSKVEIRDSEIAGNDMPFGAALDIAYTRGGNVTLTGNRIGGNRLSDGAPTLRVNGFGTKDAVNLDIQHNLVRNGTTNLVLSTNGLMQGTVACNTLRQGDLGLSIRTQTLQAPGLPLTIINNFIEDHTPPILPIYLDFGIGRGATSEVAVTMKDNWWGDASGPYDPEQNPLGRGDSVGDNITYGSWLTAPPACAPQ